MKRTHQEIIKLGAQFNKVEREEYKEFMKHRIGPLSLLLDKIDKPLLKERISKLMKSKLKTGTK